MKKKTVDLGFAVCLMISGIIGIVNGIAGIIAGFELPSVFIRTLGVISLIDLPVLVFFSVWKIKLHNSSKEKK